MKVSLRTTEYYKPQFGSIQGKMTFLGYSDKQKVYEYFFTSKETIFSWQEETGLILKKNKIYKGNTLIGAYVWEYDNNEKNKSFN